MTADDWAELGISPDEVSDIQSTDQQLDRITRYLGLDPLLVQCQALALECQQ